MAQDEAISVHLMIIGALIASIGDLSFDPKGYLLTAGNCIVTSLYLVYIPKKEREVHLNSWGLLFYNNLLSIPMVIFPVVLWEWPSLRAYPFWTDPGFQVPLSSSFSLFFLPRILFDQSSSRAEACFRFGRFALLTDCAQFTFLASAVQALLLNYTMFLCSTVNSPLATSITGQLKNLLQTLVGLFMFGDVTPTPLLNIGLAVSSFASSWYGYIKVKCSSCSRLLSLSLSLSLSGCRLLSVTQTCSTNRRCKTQQGSNRPRIKKKF
jgi:solute carrier family 35 protein